MYKKAFLLKWTIKANSADINGCNGTLTIPKFGITKKLVPGDNLIEFTPDQVGNIPYSCWMGMIRSNIKVVADASNVSASDLVQPGNQVDLPLQQVVAEAAVEGKID